MEIRIEPLSGTTSFIVAAYDDGVRVGCVFVHELPRLRRDGAMLYDVGVVESHRGRGVGKALFARLHELARNRTTMPRTRFTGPPAAAVSTW